MIYIHIITHHYTSLHIITHHYTFVYAINAINAINSFPAWHLSAFMPIHHASKLLKPPSTIHLTETFQDDLLLFWKFFLSSKYPPFSERDQKLSRNSIEYRSMLGSQIPPGVMWRNWKRHNRNCVQRNCVGALSLCHRIMGRVRIWHGHNWMAC